MAEADAEEEEEESESLAALAERSLVLVAGVELVIGS